MNLQVNPMFVSSIPILDGKASSIVSHVHNLVFVVVESRASWPPRFMSLIHICFGQSTLLLVEPCPPTATSSGLRANLTMSAYPATEQ
jgi:hypothetical protein